MREGGSVSPLEQGSSGDGLVHGGDEVSNGVDRSSGEAWDNMMRPFDQDAEEQEASQDRK